MPPSALSLSPLQGLGALWAPLPVQALQSKRRPRGPGCGTQSLGLGLRGVLDVCCRAPVWSSGSPFQRCYF